MDFNETEQWVSVIKATNLDFNVAEETVLTFLDPHGFIVGDFLTETITAAKGIVYEVPDPKILHLARQDANQFAYSGAVTDGITTRSYNSSSTEHGINNQMIQDLVDRTAFNKKNIQDLNTGIQGLETDIQGLETDIQDLNTGIQDLNTSVGNIEADIQDLEADIQNLNTNTGSPDLNTDIQNLNTRVGNIEADIRDLNTSVGNVIGNINQIQIDKRYIRTSSSLTMQSNKTYIANVSGSHAINLTLPTNPQNGDWVTVYHGGLTPLTADVFINSGQGFLDELGPNYIRELDIVFQFITFGYHGSSWYTMYY